MNDKGVWYFGKNDTGTDAPPLWICSKLEITAQTRDAKNEAWGRLLEFDDPDGTRHTWALPMELLRSDGSEYRGTLLSMGLQMAAATKARNLLTQYIQTAPVNVRARCVERTGWHGNVFVLPNRTIGDADERILYQSASASPGTIKQRGTLADWQKHVATPCAGNSRLVFAICIAFAAPLLHITGMESGGFHYRGISSTGKTTALRVAASIWGGDDYLQRWRATDNGLEALAAQHSDCLLVLDELAQVDPKVAGEIAYMLANGSGKARANRTGTARDALRWRLLFLSSGEAGLAEHMALAGRKLKAGMEVRLLDIPADAGHGLGLFDTLHNYTSGSVFSKALTESTSKYFGALALVFIAEVVKHLDKLPAVVKEAQRAFTTEHLADDAGGQAHRAALRFALVGTAGELATKWGITGWQSGDAMNAAKSVSRLGYRNAAGRAIRKRPPCFLKCASSSSFTAMRALPIGRGRRTITHRRRSIEPASENTEMRMTRTVSRSTTPANAYRKLSSMSCRKCFAAKYAGALMTRPSHGCLPNMAILSWKARATRARSDCPAWETLDATASHPIC